MSIDIQSLLMGKALGSGGGSGGVTVESLSVTENGTYTAASGKAYSPVTVNVTPTPGPLLSWDFKSETPLVDTARKIAAGSSGITFDSSGAVFDSNTDYLLFPALPCAVTIEVDVASMVMTSGTHRRFICGTTDSGLVYRSTGKWGFYGGSSAGWEDTDITDADYFAGHTVKIVVDKDSKWHIYRDNVLVFEPAAALRLGTTSISGQIPITTCFLVGSSGSSLPSAVITGVRVY